MMPAQHRVWSGPESPAPGRPGVRLRRLAFGISLSLALGCALVCVVQVQASPPPEMPNRHASATAIPAERSTPAHRERLARLKQARERALSLQETIRANRRFPETMPAAGPAAERSSRLDGRRGASAGWAPYTGPFGWMEASHLLRRALVGPRLAEVRRAAADGLEPTLDRLFAPRPSPADPGPWALAPLPDLDGWTDAQIDSLSRLFFTQQDSLQLWWSNRFLGEDPGLREAMTLFWHDHFATRADKVWIPAATYGQNVTLRTHALGNFRDLLRAMALDPAMLVWLDGNENQAGNVNENFARELLELFTMGVGHYTQEEVRSAARAFTGYVCWDGVNVRFFEDWHDSGDKTLFGRTGDFGPYEVIDLVLEQPATAEFVVRKLYRYFLDEVPDESLVQELAAEFRDGGYEIAPVMRRLLGSREFFDPWHAGCVYTDGIDRTFGLARTFELAPFDYRDHDGVQAHWAFWSMWTLGQVLLSPPNVGGWPGDRSWVNSHTLAFRRLYAATLIDGELYGEDLGRRLDPVALARQCPDPDDAHALVTDLSAFFCGVTPTPLVHERLFQELMSGMSADEWSIDHPDAAEHLERFFRLLVKLPEFQLK